MSVPQVTMFFCNETKGKNFTIFTRMQNIVHIVNFLGWIFLENSHPFIGDKCNSLFYFQSFYAVWSYERQI